MRVGFALTVVAVAFAGPAQAAIVFQQSGTFAAGPGELKSVNPDLGFGDYDVSVMFDRVPETIYGYITTRVFDFVVCDENTPDDVICGGDFGTNVEAFLDRFSPTELRGSFSISREEDGPRVFGQSLESISFEGTSANEGVGYTITITGAGSAAPVPEPATWAMMIGGFGLIGAAARRRARVKIAFARA